MLWLLLCLMCTLACAVDDPWTRVAPMPDATPLLQGDGAVREQVLERVQLVERLTKLGPGSPPEQNSRAHAMAWAWARLGQVFHAYLRPEDAAVCYRNALMLRDDVAAWRYLLGRSLLSSKQLAAASQEARRSLELDLVRSDTAFVLLAQSASLDQQADEARRLYERALEIHPKSPAALRGLAEVLLQRGQAQEAEEVVRRALRLQPDATSLLHLLGLALRDQGRRADAAAVLARVPDRHSQRVPLVDDDPLLLEVSMLRRGAQYHARRARNAAGRGLLEQAAAEYRLALERAPSRPDLLYNLAATLLTVGDRKEAFELLESLREQHPEYRQGVALDLRRTAQFEPEAVENLEQAAVERVRIDPGDALVWRALGDAAAQRGDWGLATERYGEAARNDSSRPVLSLLWLSSRALSGDVDGSLLLAAEEASVRAPEHHASFLFWTRLALSQDDTSRCGSPRLQPGRTAGRDLRRLETLALCAQATGEETTARERLREARQLAHGMESRAALRRVVGRLERLRSAQPSPFWEPSEHLELISF